MNCYLLIPKWLTGSKIQIHSSNFYLCVKQWKFNFFEEGEDVVLLLHLILQNCKTSLSGHISFKATLRPTTFCPQMYQYWREPIWLVLTCYSLINKAKPPKLINAPARHLGRVIEYTWTPMLAQTATPDVTHARRQV